MAEHDENGGSTKKKAVLWAAMAGQQVKIWKLFEIIIENK